MSNRRKKLAAKIERMARNDSAYRDGWQIRREASNPQDAIDQLRESARAAASTERKREDS